MVKLAHFKKIKNKNLILKKNKTLKNQNLIGSKTLNHGKIM